MEPAKWEWRDRREIKWVTHVVVCSRQLECVPGAQPEDLTKERTSPTHPRPPQLMEEIHRRVASQKQDRCGDVRCRMGGPRWTERDMAKEKPEEVTERLQRKRV